MSEQENLGYEAARDALIRVVQQLESGGLTLEESLALWERGEQLATQCQTWLDGARARVAGPADSDSPGDEHPEGDASAQ